MPERRIHWTALPRAATATHLEIDVFVSPRLGVDAVKTSYMLAEFPEFVDWSAGIVANEFSFDVIVDGGAAITATVEALDAVDSSLWTHLFPPTTLVEPWAFRDHSTRPIRSWPVRWVMVYLRDLYHQVGNASPTNLPTVGDLNRVVGDLGGLIDTRVAEERDNTRPETAAAVPQAPPLGCLTTLIAPWLFFLRLLWRVLLRWLHALFGIGPGGKKPAPHAHPVSAHTNWVYRPPAPRPHDPNDPFAQIEQDIAAHGVVPPEPVTATIPAAELPTYPISKAFAQVLRFYDRPESRPHKLPDPDLSQVPPPPPEPQWDFHRRLGALGDYPRLLQRLGLVIRLRIARPAGNVQSIEVVPRVNGATRPLIDVTPATVCKLEGNRFFASPLPGSDLNGGMLELREVNDRIASTQASYDVVLADADGAAMKTAIAAANINRRMQLLLLALWGVTPPEPESLPATQTAGIALVRADRAFYLKARLERARQQWLAQGGMGLTAEDVVRGYQVWVQSAKPGQPWEPWRSLCQRHGTYRLVDDEGHLVGTPITIDDLGYLKRSGATSKDGASDLYVHEAVVRWTGWSLVAPRPGKTIVPVDGTRHDARTGHAVPTQDEDAHPRVSKAAKGFRLETRFDPQQHSLPRLRFGWRYRLAMVWVDLAGLPLPALADGPLAAADELHATDEIHFRRFEPLGSPLILPRRPFTPGGSLERLVLRSDPTRDAATWAAANAPATWLVRDERRLFPPKTSQHMAELHGRFDDAIGPGGNLGIGFARALREQGTFAKPAVPSFGTPQEIADAIYNDDDHSVLVAPYLPDSLAEGAALRHVPNLALAGVSGDPLPVHTLPGTSEVVLHVPFAREKWPDLESFRLRITDANPGAMPHWDASKRVLTVHVGKSASVDILYSTYLPASDLDLMGAWDWLDDHDPSGTLRKQAELGAHWLISPARTLTLVHAVQKPLADATLSAMAASRANLGDTVALVDGTATAHLPSTGRLDLQAAWSEPIDDVNAPKWISQSHEAAVGNWVAEAASGAMPQARHEFGDTRHRNVRYRLCAASAFREYFPAGLGFSRLGPEEPVSVPSSAPPDPPKPAYLVPAFGWRDPSGLSRDVPLAVGETRERTRVGGGVRVFLERPWYSSGEGERLAVVLQGADALPPTLISLVGIDPTIAESGAAQTIDLLPTMFREAVTAPAVLLSERPATVAIASFEPSYDEERRLWICDVGVDMSKLPWGDWPFIRLALARHQPDAIAGAHLSKIVLADWAQLAPDRKLTVKRTAADRVSITVRGRGRVAPQANRVVFSFERSANAAPDPLEWLPADGTVPELPTVHTWESATHSVSSGDDQEWTATDLMIPDPQGKPLRLTVRELERRPGQGEVGRGVFRIVYADDTLIA